MITKQNYVVMSLTIVTSIVVVFLLQFFQVNTVQAKDDTIRTKRLEIVNADGELRGLMTTHEGSSLMTLLDQNGKVRFVFSVNADGSPVAVFINKNDVNTLVMAVNDDGSTAINFTDKKDVIRGSIALEADGKFWIQQSNAKGKQISSWPK